MKINHDKYYFQVAIVAKAVKCIDGVMKQDVRGKLVEKQTILMADNTGAVEVSLWAQLIQEVNSRKLLTLCDVIVCVIIPNMYNVDVSL